MTFSNSKVWFNNKVNILLCVGVCVGLGVQGVCWVGCVEVGEVLPFCVGRANVILENFVQIQMN